MRLKGIGLTYFVSEVSDIATGNILTTTSASYSDVSGIIVTGFNAALGDILLITCAFVIRADSGSVGRAIVTVNDNSSLFDIASTERTSGSAGEIIPVTVSARYVVANAPASGAVAAMQVKLRGKRNSGAGNAYVSSPVTLVVQAMRGL